MKAVLGRWRNIIRHDLPLCRKFKARSQAG